MRRSYDEAREPVESLPTGSRRMICPMKQSSSVEAFYALVFAVCCLVALLMLSY
jgi:hypothetical protein